jgi:hypothetical protein
LKFTTEVATKFVPLTVSVNAAPPAVALVGESDVIEGTPGRLDSWKFAGVPTPGTVAVTVYDPAAELAVNVGAVATPEASVATLAVAAPPANVPLAPVLGAVKVTVTPETRLPPPSFTVALRAANALLMTTLWGVPAVAVILAAGPAKLVKEKLAGAATPETVAATV